MNPITMYAAAQIVAERRRNSEATARQRRLTRSDTEPAGPVRLNRALDRPAHGDTAPDSSTRAA